MDNALVVHKGSIMSTEEEVRRVIVPEPTETYTPVAHGLVIDLLDRACVQVGLDVEEKKYALSTRKPKRPPEHDPEMEWDPPLVIGERMFGLWLLNHEDNGHKWGIGLRNSYDKSFALSITAGLKIFVCDNLAFSGEYVGFRKHTSGVDEAELQRLARSAVVKVAKKIDAFSKWHRALRAIPITDDEAMVIMVEGMERKVFNPSQFKKLLECWREEKRIATEPTMYSVFASFTRLHRENDLFKIAQHTGIAEQLIDERVMLKQAN